MIQFSWTGNQTDSYFLSFILATLKINLTQYFRSRGGTYSILHLAFHSKPCDIWSYISCRWWELTLGIFLYRIFSTDQLLSNSLSNRFCRFFFSFVHYRMFRNTKSTFTHLKGSFVCMIRDNNLHKDYIAEMSYWNSTLHISYIS